MAKDIENKTFSAKVVVVLVAQCLKNSKSSLDYKRMAALDGKRTACSFQHEFREIVKAAKALNAQVDNGAKPTLNPGKPKGAAGTNKRPAPTTNGVDSDSPDASPLKKSRVKKSPKTDDSKVKHEFSDQGEWGGEDESETLFDNFFQLSADDELDEF